MTQMRPGQLGVFTIFDSKAQSFIQPFFSLNNETAKRDLTKAVRQEGGQFNEFAEDYTLFHLGWFDQDQGHFDLMDAPVAVCKAISLTGREHEGLGSLIGLPNEATQ